MKQAITVLIGAALLTGCSEETTAAVKVLKKKSERQIVAAAGEAEVALELFKNQYASIKEKLIRLKTLHKLYDEKLDEAYAAKDVRKIHLYENQIKILNQKIPEAEGFLKDFYAIYQNQKQELYLLKEDTAIHQTMGSAVSPVAVYNEAEHRAEKIKELTDRLRERSKRAQSLVEVNQLEETFIQ